MMNRLFFSPLFVSTSDDEPTFLLPLICVDNRSIDRSTDRPTAGRDDGWIERQAYTPNQTFNHMAECLASLFLAYAL